LRFVSNKPSQLIKAPAVKAALMASLSAPLHSFANVRQILQNNGFTFRGGLNNPLTQNVVVVPPAPKLFATQPPQMTTGRSGTFSLERTSQSEGPSLQLLPAPLSQKTIVTGNGWTVNPQINSDDFIGWPNLRGGNVYHHMQPQPILSQNQVSGSRWVTCILERIGRNLKRDRQASLSRGKAYSLLIPLQRVGALIVSGWTQLTAGPRSLPTLFLQNQCRSNCFSRLDPGLNQQIGRQFRMLPPQEVIGLLVQVYPIFALSLPTALADVVKAACELLKRLPQNGSLLRSGLQQQSDGSFHPSILVHIFRVFIVLNSKRRVLLSTAS